MANPVIAEIRNKAFPRLSVPRGTVVVWRNADPMPHSVETKRDASFYFTGGALHPGEKSSPVYFAEPGNYPYLCRFHDGMEGTVEVTESGPVVNEPGSSSGQPPDHRHLHGFVTGGRSGRRLFMTHTPVIADDRHSYQVIVQGRFASDAHVEAYDGLRREYGPGLVQIFHHHVSMPGIGRRQVRLLPHARVAYYPGNVETDVPGLEADVPVKIDRVIHCHKFEPDTDYPDGLEYLMYGDADDVFIDHHITRAPSFHSVAKLARPPSFWDGGAGEAIRFTVPSKRIREVEPKTLERVAVVDNAFHLVWLPPPGLIPPPPDPLKRRDGTPSVHAVRTGDGQDGEIEIADAGFLWMDVKLLNYGVLIP
jgi:hypothetical protein